jgi:hypothetical protein
VTRADPAPAAKGSDEDGWVVSPVEGWQPAHRAKELWAYREMVLFLAVRDLQVRYKQAVFGILWAVVQPLVGAAVFVVVFSRLADVPSDGLPYLLFAFLGYAVWTYFSSSLTSANASLVANSALVTKVYFPRLAAPLSSVLPGLVDLGIALVMAGVLMAVFGVAPGWPLLTLPLWLFLVALLAFGVGRPARDAQRQVPGRALRGGPADAAVAVRLARGLSDEPRPGPLAARVPPQPDGRSPRGVPLVGPGRTSARRVRAAVAAGRCAPAVRWPDVLPAERAPLRRRDLTGGFT